MDCRIPSSPILHYLLEFVQIHVYWVGDAIQPSHPLPSPSPPAFNLSQHRGLFQWVGSSCQVARVLELQLQHQSFQWIFRVDFLNKIENDTCPTLKHSSSLTGYRKLLRQSQLKCCEGLNKEDIPSNKGEQEGLGELGVIWIRSWSIAGFYMQGRYKGIQSLEPSRRNLPLCFCFYYLECFPQLPTELVPWVFLSNPTSQ